MKFTEKLRSLFKRSDLTPEFWDDFEEILLTSDVGVGMTEKIIAAVKTAKTHDEFREIFSSTASSYLRKHTIEFVNKPHVIIVAGVNGAGKTTTIAKLAMKLKSKGLSVMLVAADTFRAAAILQLKIWGKRIGVPVIAQQQDSDPAAVAFDGVKSAVAKGIDVVLIDTAGRQHTNKNLMTELSKVKKVVEKALSGAPHDILLVLDATVGQNGLSQAKMFNDDLGVTGVILTKMDGTAKGGVIFPISAELALPVSYIGTGEGVNDLEIFDVKKFVQDMM